mmetsp:Transcript_1528/g.5495  ORF Transcript_1528/g.5495 Transcript_1528/m.5495 type:complete len:214 (-) Transcript_1528:105-746(-)
MCRALPRFVPTEASPVTAETSLTVRVKSSRTQDRPGSINSNSFRAQGRTFRSSHVPAVFQTELAEMRFSVSSAGDSGASSNLEGPWAEGGSFVSRCLYHVIGVLSSSLSSFSSTLFFFFVAAAAPAPFFGTAVVLLSFSTTGAVQTRLWNFQSSRWHWAEQYPAFLQMLQRTSLSGVAPQLPHLGFGTSGFLVVTSFAFSFSSSLSTMLSNLL